MLLFDIGANDGKYAIANLANNNIISVEASTITYKVLLENIKQYENIVPINYAVTSDNIEYAKFYHCHPNTISSMDYEWLSSDKSRFGNYKNNLQVISVPTITIDKLVETYGKPDIIKIDVEGYEDNVIKSLTQKVNILCFEWAAEWRDKYIDAIDHLVSLGYSQFHIQNGDDYLYRPDKYTLNSQETKEHLIKSIDKVDWGMIWCI